jgi:hypothetical protein
MDKICRGDSPVERQSQCRTLRFCSGRRDQVGRRKQPSLRSKTAPVFHPRRHDRRTRLKLCLSSSQISRPSAQYRHRGPRIETRRFGWPESHAPDGCFCRRSRAARIRRGRWRRDPQSGSNGFNGRPLGGSASDPPGKRSRTRVSRFSTHASHSAVICGIRLEPCLPR